MNRTPHHKLMGKGGAEMDTKGLWELFFATGLPEVYLALCGRREEAAAAFHPEQRDKTKI